ncbi:MAG TPA: VOC family protein [bacterium]|nr:VOC family protein [bacterium]
MRWSISTQKETIASEEMQRRLSAALRIRAGDTIIWLHRPTSEHGLNSPLSADISTFGLVVHVDDVDAHCEHARAAGADVETEPADQEYGQREYGVRDLEGHRWWFATPVSVQGTRR